VPHFWRPPVGCTLYERPDGAGQSWDRRIGLYGRRRNSDGEIHRSDGTLHRYVAGKVSSVKCDWISGKTECDAVLFGLPGNTGLMESISGKSGIVNLPAHLNDKVFSIYIQCKVF